MPDGAASSPLDVLDPPESSSSVSFHFMNPFGRPLFGETDRVFSSSRFAFFFFSGEEVFGHAFFKPPFYARSFSQNAANSPLRDFVSDSSVVSSLDRITSMAISPCTPKLRAVLASFILLPPIAQFELCTNSDYPGTALATTQGQLPSPMSRSISPFFVQCCSARDTNALPTPGPLFPLSLNDLLLLASPYFHPIPPLTFPF